MLEKIEVNNSYYNSENFKVRVLFVDSESVFYFFINDNSRGFVNRDFVLKSWSEIPTQKKRYWLWDMKTRDNGYICKCVVYLDDDGIASDGSNSFQKHTLIKKHENEWIEV